MESLAYAGGSKPVTSGVIKRSPLDFQVDEVLGFDLETNSSTEYPHNWLQIRKTGINTSHLAQLLAHTTGNNLRDIGYSGMKDRHAITTQWFSVPSSDNASIFDFEKVIDRELAGTTQRVEILTSVAHPKKLKRGVHRKNRFKIIVRDTHQFDESILARIKNQGVPNYFGTQRFGKRFSNLTKAQAMFERDPRRVKREQRGIYLSTARSFLFNQIVSARLIQGNWLRPLAAEPINLNASGSIFVFDPEDTNIEDRIISGDIHTTGALWGTRLTEQTQTEIELFENQVVCEWPILRDGLVKFGLKAARRPLRVMLENFNWHLKGEDLELNFELTKGSYATSVLREILSFNDASIQNFDVIN